MTSNQLKSAILLEAMAAIVPQFDKKGDARQTEIRAFTVEYAFHPAGNCQPACSGEIRVLDAATNVETFRGEAPSFLDARKGLRGECREQTRSNDACTSIDRDGDELITVFASRSLGDVTPGFDHGTYAILGGTGKFKGFSATGAYTWAMMQSSCTESVATFAIEVMHKQRCGVADCVASGPAYSPIAA